MILNQLINAASIGSVLFLSLLTLSKKTSTRYGYWFLTLLFLSIALIFADTSLNYLDVYEVHPALTLFIEPLLFVFAPLIYLSVTYLTSPDKRVPLKIVFHFIPYLLVTGLYAFAYLKDSGGTQIANDADDQAVEIFLLLLFFIHLFIYLYASIRKLKRHRLTLPLFVSNLSDNDYHWLYKVILGLSFLSAISFAEVVFDQLHIPFYFSIFYLIAFYYIGIQIARQKDVFPFTSEQRAGVSDLISVQSADMKASITPEWVEFSKEEKDKSPDELSSVRRAVIAEEAIAHCRDRLLHLMESEKPYLDSDITLPRLAKLLDLTTYQTSYLINSCFNENFYLFINRYRLEKCKQMFTDPSCNHLSILGVAFEAGFNSKTTFNTAFKKATGLSPKEFRQKADRVKNRGSAISTH